MEPKPNPYSLERLNRNDLVTTLDAIAAIDPSNPENAGVVSPRPHGRAAANQDEIDAQDREHRYSVRNELIYTAISRALNLGMVAGFDVDPAEPDFMVAYIDLPESGQVSWHMPKYPAAYDGHSTPEKYFRVSRYVMRVAGADICRCGHQRAVHAGHDGMGRCSLNSCPSMCSAYALGRRGIR